MPDSEESIRHEASVLARRKKARIVAFSREAPIDWRPGTVTNPDDGRPFTEAGAWELIASLLEACEPLTAVDLQCPPGKKGFVMTPCIAGREVYIKFQLGGGTIIGRSFHYSIRS
jgi:hypothetical protein